MTCRAKSYYCPTTDTCDFVNCGKKVFQKELCLNHHLMQEENIPFDIVDETDFTRSLRDLDTLQQKNMNYFEQLIANLKAMRQRLNRIQGVLEEKINEKKRRLTGYQQH